MVPSRVVFGVPGKPCSSQVSSFTVFIYHFHYTEPHPLVTQMQILQERQNITQAAVFLNLGIVKGTRFSKGQYAEGREGKGTNQLLWWQEGQERHGDSAMGTSAHTFKQGQRMCQEWWGTHLRQKKRLYLHVFLSIPTSYQFVISLGKRFKRDGKTETSSFWQKTVFIFHIYYETSLMGRKIWLRWWMACRQMSN